MKSHLIDRANVEINVDFYGQDVFRTDMWKAWTVERLLGTVEVLCEELSPPDKVIKINQLDIDIDIHGIDPDSPIPQNLVDAIRRNIDDKISESLINPESFEFSDRYDDNIIINYIRNGFLSQAFSISEWDLLVGNFIKKLRANKDLTKEVILITRSTQAFLRFFRLMQFDDLNSLIISITGDYSFPLKINILVEFMNSNRKYFRQTNKIEIAQVALLGRIEQDLTLDGILIYLLESTLLSEIDGITLERFVNQHLELRRLFDREQTLHEFAASRTIPQEEIYGTDEAGTDKIIQHPESEHISASFIANNAGIVLMSPFLLSFLKELNQLNDENKLVDPERTVMLLHYLATGRTHSAEWELAFMKLICGIPISNNCAIEIDPADNEIAECNKLLENVIGHWSKLGRASIEGLRETFLSRSGRLSESDNSWRLTFAERAEDILLRYIPWSYSTLFMPWMKKPVLTEW